MIAGPKQKDIFADNNQSGHACPSAPSQKLVKRSHCYIHLHCRCNINPMH